MFEFNWQYKDFEIRTKRYYDRDGKEMGFPYVELIKWYMYKGRRTCFTLAYFHEDDEGFELHFVGDRPFEEIAEIDISPIWKQLWLAGEMLQDAWRKERGYA